MIIEGMAMQGAEPTYCMGDDSPLPVLSSRPHALADYFKQRFAQVPFFDMHAQQSLPLFIAESVSFGHRDRNDVMPCHEAWSGCASGMSMHARLEFHSCLLSCRPFFDGVRWIMSTSRHHLVNQPVLVVACCLREVVRKSAGNEPSHRPAARRAGDVAGDATRQARQPAQPRPRLVRAGAPHSQYSSRWSDASTLLASAA